MIRTAPIETNLDAICQQIKCDEIRGLPLLDDTMFVNIGNTESDAPDGFFVSHHYGPLRGMAVVVKVDRENDNAIEPPTTPLERLRSEIFFVETPTGPGSPVVELPHVRGVA